LLYEDLFIETPQVREALRRLPDDLMQARLRRMKTASQCYATQTELPAHEWITEEQDVLYLSPYVSEVEREEFDRVNYWQ
jgi:ubiquinol-cytochrome c reductase subunit 7